jgi:hypothetical protein
MQFGSCKKSGQIDGVRYKFVPSIQDTKMEFLVNMKAVKHDALIDTYEHKVGPRNGARVVARAWVDLQ